MKWEYKILKTHNLDDVKREKRIENKKRARYRRIRDLGEEDEEREVDLRKEILNSPR